MDEQNINNRDGMQVNALAGSASQGSAYFEGYTKNMALLLTGAALADAAVFFVCSQQILYSSNPCQFLTPFIWATAVLLVFVLRKNSLIVKKQAFVWLAPLLSLSVFFWFCEPTFLMVLNMPVSLLLFAAFAASAAQRETGPHTGLSMLARVLALTVGNWYAVFLLLPIALRRETADAERRKAAGKVLLGVFCAAPVMLVIFALLISADEVFRVTLNNTFYGLFDLLEHLRLEEQIPKLVLSAMVFIYAVGYVGLTEKYKDKPLQVFVPKGADSLASMGFLIPINLLFAIFTVFQVAFLWGSGLMQLPDGMLYSQYAREGFFQLLFVTVINFSIILYYALFTDIGKLSFRVRGLLVSLCAFTGVLAASSFYRMFLYIGTYGYTSLRLCVVTFLSMEVFWLLAAVFFLAGWRVKLGRWIVITGIAFYLIMNVTGSAEFANWMHENYFVSAQHQPQGMEMRLGMYCE